MSDEADGAGQEAQGPPDENRFLVDDEPYDIPSLYALDMDENKIVYDLSGSPAEDWIFVIETAKAPDITLEEAKELSDKIRNPGFLRALVHVAYRRAHLEAKHHDIETAVGKSNHIANWTALFLPSGEGDAADPPLSGTTSGPEKSSLSEPDESKPTNEKSSVKTGNGSRNDSEKPDATPEPTGTGESATSSRRWGRIKSAV